MPYEQYNLILDRVVIFFYFSKQFSTFQQVLSLVFHNVCIYNLWHLLNILNHPSHKRPSARYLHCFFKLHLFDHYSLPIIDYWLMFFQLFPRWVYSKNNIIYSGQILASVNPSPARNRCNASTSPNFFCYNYYSLGFLHVLRKLHSDIIFNITETYYPVTFSLSKLINILKILSLIYCFSPNFYIRFFIESEFIIVLLAIASLLKFYKPKFFKILSAFSYKNYSRFSSTRSLCA